MSASGNNPYHDRGKATGWISRNDNSQRQLLRMDSLYCSAGHCSYLGGSGTFHRVNVIACLTLNSKSQARVSDGLRSAVLLWGLPKCPNLKSWNSLGFLTLHLPSSSKWLSHLATSTSSFQRCLLISSMSASGPYPFLPKQMRIKQLLSLSPVGFLSFASLALMVAWAS